MALVDGISPSISLCINSRSQNKISISTIDLKEAPN